jgi:hypothetical protein
MKKLILGLLISATVAACTGDATPGGPAPKPPGGKEPAVPPIKEPGPKDPGRPVTPAMPAPPAELVALKAQLAALPRTADELLAAHAVQYLERLPYDPAQSVNLPAIQGSRLSLSPAESAALKARGFVICDREPFVTFVHGYRDIYAEHLPVYVSADSVLYALHRSYDAILRTLEQQELIKRMRLVLAGARTRLAQPTPAASAQARADVDLFLAVALSLLDDKELAPVAGGDAATIRAILARAKAATGEAQVTLFGVERSVDFSQFDPRGHYTLSPELSQYFRAMIWLGRTELRLIETLPDGSQVFRRRQFDDAVLLRALVDEAGLAAWKAVDQVVRAFVGEPDDLSLPDIDRLMADLGAASAADLLARSDQEIAGKIIEKGYGTQRIASQIMVNGLELDTLPLGRSFLFFGQRYVLDSHVFSNVVYDRVKKAQVKRMMPDPLDVAFAALGNDAAAALLGPGLRKHDYASELASMQVLAQGHGADFWSSNLYNRWLSALRALSPARDLRPGMQSGLPSVARTEGWARRVLNTQLASWAELRHDTILYAKQSYTAAPACEYPDAYVDPYPEFWRGLAALASDGAKIAGDLGLDAQTHPGIGILGFFQELQSTSSILAEMADRQRTGMPFTPEQLMFINQAVSLKPFGCYGEIGEGWYPKLFFDQEDSLKFDPTIADVHTQPADEGGNPVGKVLHVATGHPRLMVVTVDTCSGPRAYAGVTSSYFEKITESWKRLDDKEWSKEVGQTNPPPVPWMSDLVVR